MIINENKTGTSGLDPIIKEVSKSSFGSGHSSTSKIYIVDYKTGEMRDEPPFFDINKRWRYFEIDPGAVAIYIKGPEVPVRYLNSPKPLMLRIVFDAKIHDKGIFNLIRSVYNANTPIDGINLFLKQKIDGWLFEKKNFVSELKQNTPLLEEFIKATGLRCGLDLSPRVEANVPDPGNIEAEPFISLSYEVVTKTKDGQVVEIDHTLALTLNDPIKLKLSGIKDVRNWLRGKLDQYTKNAIIEKNYAEVIINMQASIIKDPIKEECNSIGYELKQLITVPGLDKEKFYFETIDANHSELTEYVTKDTRLKIPLNIVVEGRLDLQAAKTRKCIVPGFDIIATLRKNVVGFARGYINGITPDECFSSQFEFEEKLSKFITQKLEGEYGFKELQLVIKFLENDLSKRLALLMERPYKTELRGDWSERRYYLWFRVAGVANDGWYRFRATNYKTTEEELDDIGRIVKNCIENAILRTGSDITGKVISTSFAELQKRVAREFGLIVILHDLTEDFSEEEEIMIRRRKDDNEERILRSRIVLESERNQLSQTLKQKERAIEAEENEEEIKKIDARIASFKVKEEGTKAKFLKQRTDTNFLNPPDETSNNE